MSPDETVRQAADTTLKVLDKLIIMALEPETYPAVAAHTRELSRLVTRAELLLSFIAAGQPKLLSIVRNRPA